MGVQSGLSNFRSEQVWKFHEFALSKGFVLPTVYKGSYNPIGRHIEKDLFLVLRKFKICFYAYFPIAGGFLVKSLEPIKISGTGRWDPTLYGGKIYHGPCNKRSLVEALSEWDTIAGDCGVPKAELAYRWVAFNSLLNGNYEDGMIIGANAGFN